MRKLAIAGVLALLWVLPASIPAFAGGNSSTPCAPVPQPSTCTYTQNLHGVVQTFPSNVPCVDPATGPPTGMLTLTSNEVFHVTVNRAGDGWITGTSEGSFSFTPFDPTRPSYTGHYTSWFGGSFNQKNLVFHDTFNVHGTGSDGSSLDFHMIDHFSISASGVVLVFDKASC